MNYSRVAHLYIVWPRLSPHQVLQGYTVGQDSAATEKYRETKCTAVYISKTLKKWFFSRNILSERFKAEINFAFLVIRTYPHLLESNNNIGQCFDIF